MEDSSEQRATPIEKKTLIQRENEVTPLFELNAPKFSREFVKAFFELQKMQYEDPALQAMIQEKTDRTMKPFEGVGENDEDKLIEKLHEKIDQQLKDPNVSDEERRLLIDDKNRIDLVGATVREWRDPLTGLYNRTGLVEILGLIVKRPDAVYKDVESITKPEFAVMIVDIDKLKEINDNHGHAEGDRVIGQAAEILKTSVRPADIVARVGGDEFVILVFKQDAKGEDTHLISKNILGGVTKKVGEGSMIGLTYGADTEKTFDDIKKVVESENPQQELTKIFSEADKALYIAKTGKKQAERKAIESSDYSI
ncbi:MAG: Diguanylate cyclase [Candidatus Woesebacteria bacterium GW2011_GWA1_39_21]|uniref:Diguanylate cyclase n=1 Tax=Candidatus Woesebacteria bacterium GW2011_GWA1_39_21 TaxID=1618550 RepID=A0A0G0N121_9BACT|nr:MAG: Diguanylate cyclase [Candidatus Woesebacteria bacterium GW2011_GWA1_39_21]